MPKIFPLKSKGFNPFGELIGLKDEKLIIAFAYFKKS